jgi:hypothetical protein
MALEEFTGALRVRSALASRQVSLEWKNPVVLPCYTGRSIDVVRRENTQGLVRSRIPRAAACRPFDRTLHCWNFATEVMFLVSVAPTSRNFNKFFFLPLPKSEICLDHGHEDENISRDQWSDLGVKTLVTSFKEHSFSYLFEIYDWSMRSILRVRLGACHDIKLQIWTVCKIVRYDNFIDLWLIDHDNLIDLWFNWLLKANRMYLTKAPLFASFVSTRNRSAKLYRYTGWMLPIEIDGQG